MCKITVPRALVKSAPISWEELAANSSFGGLGENLSLNLDLKLDNFAIDANVKPVQEQQEDWGNLFGMGSNEVFFDYTPPSTSTAVSSPTGIESLFPCDYDMSLFGLFPQEDSLLDIDMNGSTTTPPSLDAAVTAAPLITNDEFLFNYPITASTEEADSNATCTVAASEVEEHSAPSHATSSPTSSSSSTKARRSPKDSSASTLSSSFDPTSRLQKRKLGNTNAKKSEDGISDDLRRKRQKQREAAKRCRDKRMSALQIAEERADKAEAEKLELLVKVRALQQANEEWMQRQKMMEQQIERLSNKMQF